MDAEPLIRDISDTARWAAVFRARESTRPDALFHDPYASRLAGERGHRILEEVPHAAENDWAWIMRTVLFDRLLAEELDQGADLVINLAAGLDARPYRMPLPASLHWVEIDLPHMIVYKSGLLAEEQPACRLERIPLDLADAPRRRETLANLARGHKRTVALTEGLLIYLTPEQNADLARDLADAGVHTWIMDIGSPGLLKMLQATTGQATEKASAPLIFGPAEGPAFFERYGWKTADAISVFQTAIETNRVPPELEQYKDFPQPKPPFTSDYEIWSGICRLTHE